MVFPSESSTNMNMLSSMSMAFFNGMEDANRFLPADDVMMDGRGRMKRSDMDGEMEAGLGRSSKQITALPRSVSEEEEETTALREFRDMYAKASDVDLRLEEFDEIVRVHYDPDLEDNETRKATVARLWRRLEKELDDRAETVVSGAFKYTFAPLKPRHQSLGSSTCA